jgi:hypothetical protein
MMHIAMLLSLAFRRQEGSARRVRRPAKSHPRSALPWAKSVAPQLHSQGRFCRRWHGCAGQKALTV